MHVLTIQAFNNDHKSFQVPYQPGQNIMQLVNQPYADPRREGIPFLCNKGACRSCTIRVIDRSDLLQEPSKNEKRALGVGRTTIALGYRLACLCYFKESLADEEQACHKAASAAK